MGEKCDQLLHMLHILMTSTCFISYQINRFESGKTVEKKLSEVIRKTIRAAQGEVNRNANGNIISFCCKRVIFNFSLAVTGISSSYDSPPR